MTSKGIETARKELPALVEQAHRGQVTIITKRGVPYAALVPLSAVPRKQPKLTMARLRGSGRKVWREDARLAVERLRGEWT
jgi:prevent-host-death family protein